MIEHMPFLIVGCIAGFVFGFILAKIKPDPTINDIKEAIAAKKITILDADKNELDSNTFSRLFGL